MIRLQDIADMAGVSRTTVSNVLKGNTKRVSLETIDRIRAIINENEYEPSIGSMMLSGKGSRIIGFIMGYENVHGYPATMDSFIGALMAAVWKEAEEQGYYVMLIGGDTEKKIVEIASRWNVEGLILIGYSEERYRSLCKKLNKKAVLVDTYTTKETYDYQNVGIDDFDGGYQIGRYLKKMGYPNALFIAEETHILCDERHKRLASDKPFCGLCNEMRWRGFKKAMEEDGSFCSIRRFVVVDEKYERRVKKYEQLLPVFIQVGALALASDYNAIEMINFLHDHGIRVPEEVSVIGFDDCIYAEYVRPRLTTVHQSVSQKGKTAVRRLIRMLNGETLPETYTKADVKLVIRDSVIERVTNKE